MKILLAPHADDETLFACYTLLRERPLVLLCLHGAPRHGDREVREAEMEQAIRLLGCSWINLSRYDLRKQLALYKPTHVWAPLPEPDGNSDHNHVGNLAAALWPGRVSFYATYTQKSRTVLGERVESEPSWPALKRQALACYRSQQTHPGTRAHFERPLDEYLVPWEMAEL